MTQAQPYQDIDAILDVLAVLGRADQDTLTLILDPVFDNGIEDLDPGLSAGSSREGQDTYRGMRVSSPGAASDRTVRARHDVAGGSPLGAVHEHMIAQLTARPDISWQDGLLVMAPDAASIRLEALEENDLLHFRRLHQRAATILAERLCAGSADVEQKERKNVEVEAVFMDVFTRLAEHLRHQDPTQLPALTDAVRHAPLRNRQNRYYRTYMEGISLQQTGQYDALQTLCDTLLAQADLALELRGRTHNLRATALYLLGRLQLALDDYRASLAIMQQTGNNLSAGIVLQNMGALACDLQDYPEAERRLRQAADIFATEGSAVWKAAVENELGLVYQEQGKWAQALQCFKEFISQARVHAAHDDVAIGLLNIGEVLLFQGRLP